MEFILQPWHLLLTILAGWVNHQQQAVIEYLRTGRLPFAFEETVELMKIIIAGIRSRDEGGRVVRLQEIDA